MRHFTYGLAAQEGFEGDSVICLYCDDVQVAAAVKLGDVYADATGCRYHIVSHLSTPAIKALLCPDKDAALAWLNFLADLYEGTYKK